MHREVRKNLEDILAGNGGLNQQRSEHLSGCPECSTELSAMREQRRMIQSLRADDSTPGQSAGFYARVMERIEAQGVASIWSLFFESRVGRGLAMASMVMALTLGLYMVSSESSAGPESAQAAVARQHSSALTGGILTGSPDPNAVLVNLVTYREQ